ncbi:M48 family metalloprotease [Leptolyngbya sp. NK1-12]|uniref:M48 family metalloprotease n=2 Tax=Leptolyngbya sp. NK1-12 TaxID=2547451 RepID=A0AA96WJI8_9CYAN|nr:M48 family metalloprotease [Leptolyngbya sp. NK1-12]
MPSEAAAILAAGNKALKQGQYAEAVEKLEAFCYGTDSSFKDYEQAQTWLAKAYRHNHQIEQSIALCRTLVSSEKPFIKIWAEQYLQAMAPSVPAADAAAAATAATETQSNHSPESGKPSSAQSATAAPSTIPKARRSKQRGVKLAMKGVASNLTLASGVTIVLLCGMVLAATLNLLLIQGADDPTSGLISAILITIIFNLAMFLLGPIIMDLVQKLIYDTRWVSLSEIERRSPESAKVIRRVCQQHHIQTPRLGIIDDENPTAFTYGSFPNSARLVVSQGLFTYLDDDEAATVYAHELGHIVHWDFAVMTLASTLVQVCYLIYTYARAIADQLGDSDSAKKVKGGIQSAVILAYIFYIVGEYLLLYLSRTREYYADHFAAEVTGNPNGLSRALVKIAYGILEEGKRSDKPSKVLQGTRALGISDPRSASMTGTAYRVAAEPEKVGRVFLWDMFNPWAWWMELNSTHPLTGKRVRALTTYAEQLGLDSEFDMARMIREGRTLNKRKLHGSFMLDILLFWAEWLGGLAGLALGIALLKSGTIQFFVLPPMLMLLGFGIGLLLKTWVMYPSLHRAPEMDVLLLMSDPYASPLRGKPVQLAGQIIGRGDSGSRFGSDLKLQDPTGLIYLHYASRFGPLGNFLFGMSQAASFVNQEVAVTGWFRRGVMPWVDMTLMTCPNKWNVSSHHRFWALLLAIGAIILAFTLPILIPT